MVIYNIKSKHFTLVYNEVEDGWFAMHSGKAKGYKVKLWVDSEELPTNVYVSLGEVSLRDEKELNEYVDILQDASVFAELIHNLDADKLKPI